MSESDEHRLCAQYRQRIAELEGEVERLRECLEWAEPYARKFGSEPMRQKLDDVLKGDTGEGS